ncbi:FAD-dependent oxidoreductase [Geomonas sp. Red32]|uniref:NAD(P)/FAD-dependent oxidoreductase n=1 Tax=Geomonas sp. Red32 TaxID=2912856 RepID=UPI00202CD585|nr:FAD-dependent oxidoreductase [Geomonas sp. Red32]MCM0080555.1 FAD-dependent oxidoreductase [Geomonas sp. Red32]
MPHFDIVIIGNSAAGLQAIRTIRRHCRRTTIALIDREDSPAYSRVLTPYFIGGKTGRDNLFIVDGSFYREMGVATFFGQAAAALDPERGEVRLDNGETLHFGSLLLALGSEARPFSPGLKRVSTLRHMADADKLEGLLKPAACVTALGAGLVSVPVLSHLSPDVERHLIVSSGRIFSRLLDAESAAILEEHFTAAGVHLHKRNDIVEVSEGDRLHLTLASGEKLATDALVVGKGVIPNTTLARQAGLIVKDGIVVDEHCRTSYPAIYAAGDAAEGKDFVTGETTVQGNWITAVEQGEVAALNMLGLDRLYEGSMKNNITEVFGIDVAVVGYCSDDAPRTVTHGSGASRRFRKLFLNEKDRIIGAVVIGETNDSGLYYQMVRARSPFPGKQLLHGDNRYGAFMLQIA